MSWPLSSSYGGNPAAPYYGQYSSEKESFAANSSNSDPPAFRTGYAGDIWMGTDAPYHVSETMITDYDNGFPNTDFDNSFHQDFSEFSNTAYRSTQNEDNTEPLLSLLNSEDAHHQPTGVSHSNQSLYQSDQPTTVQEAVHNPYALGSFESLPVSIDGAAQFTDLLGGLRPTPILNVDSMYQHDDPPITASLSKPAGSARAKSSSSTGRRRTKASSSSPKDTVTTRLPSQEASNTHVSSKTKQRPITAARTRTSRKPIKQDSDADDDFVEADATYDFAVTDKDDVFLDPKPVMAFGKHEPRLAVKVSQALKEIREEAKNTANDHVSEKTMAQIHESLKAQNAAMKLQLGPRSQKPKADPSVLWKAPPNDYTIPVTAYAYGVCLDLLMNAIFNREDCSETQNKEFENRWLGHSTYYTEPLVKALAEQILDAMIEVHEHGFAHQVLDPAYNLRYKKTMHFTFRDRFNTTARVLKHSKTTCNELFKGFRLYDIIGGSYDLETRIKSNGENNAKKAEKERRRKAAEAAKQPEQETKGQGTKRAREQQDGENPDSDPDVKHEPEEEQLQSERPKKKAKIAAGLSHKSAADSSDFETATAAPNSATGADADAPHEDADKLIVVLKVPALKTAVASINATNSRHTKRAITEVDGAVSSSSAKKSKTSPQSKAKVKASGKTKSTPARQDLKGTDHDKKPKPRGRSKGAVKPASGPRSTRTSRRTTNSAADAASEDSLVSATVPPR